MSADVAGERLGLHAVRDLLAGELADLGPSSGVIASAGGKLMFCGSKRSRTFC